MIKYMLHPGWVESKNLDDLEHVNAPALARFYRVPFEECAINDGRPGIDPEAKGVQHLHPVYTL